MNRLEVPEPLSLGGRMLEKVCSRMLNVGAGRYPQTSSVYILLTRAVRDDHPYRENAWEDSFQLVTNPVLSLYAGRKDWILVLLNSRHEAVLGFLITPPDAIAPAHSLGCSKGDRICPLKNCFLTSSSFNPQHLPNEVACSLFLSPCRHWKFLCAGEQG
nr:uncharacterized protein LOC116152749 isoform X4 [Camelus dromedarius]